MITRRLHLGPDSLVIEVASNDGYLLKNFVAAGIRCGSGPHVDRDIRDAATKTPDHLHLRMRRVLEMHAAHGADAAGPGVIDLPDLALAKHGLQFLGAEEAGEGAAGIPVRHRLHNLEAGQRRVEDLHVVAQPNPAVAASAT
jgi:hypothetical protein